MKGVRKIARFKNQKYYNYLHSPEWQQKRQAVIERSRSNAPVGSGSNPFGRCEKCGYSPFRPGVLQTHHLTYERLYNEDLGDLLLVCPRCHQKLTEEARMKKLEDKLSKEKQ